jgi:biotin carboxyl carrier protein
MSFLPDPAALYATADRIARHAEELRARATRLVAAAAHARWHSPAARAFRQDVAGIAEQMRHAAGRVDDAADALRRHARRIEDELAVVAAGEAIVAHTAGTVVSGAVHTGERVLHAIGVL